MDIKLPDGYQFYNLDPELDAPLVSETWIHRRDDDLPYTQGKLKYLPSVGVKFGDRLVSFEMVCPSGSMNHLYTLPEFRGKGLGTAVELKLCQKLITMDIWPFKRVITENTKTVEMTLKLPYWKELKDGKSNEATVGEFRRLKHRSSRASIETSYHNKN
jgi:GNAT superfamily N-acetyltransferase